MRLLSSREISESAVAPTCFGFYISRLVKSNVFGMGGLQKAESPSPVKVLQMRGAPLYSIRVRRRTRANARDTLALALSHEGRGDPLASIRVLYPRHSRESGNPEGGVWRARLPPDAG